MITFIVPGEARGKGRPRFARQGKFVRTYTDDRTASFENLVTMAGSQAMAGRTPIEGSCCVGMEILVGVPKSWSKRKQAQALDGTLRPTGKPDIDNVVKAIMDALNGVTWKDDAQVVALAVAKRYAPAPKTTITIYGYQSETQEGKACNVS